MRRAATARVPGRAHGVLRGSLPFIAAAALAGCTGIFFQPSRRLFLKPEDFGAIYETVRFASADGTRLTGLFFPARRTPATGTVVHFHGNAENMTTHFLFSSWLVDYGFHVLVFDYRGYGASEGRSSLRGAIEDGRAAIAYARSREDVDPKRVVVFAQSLGGALAIASLAGMPEPGIRALALESTFSSYSGVAQDKMARLLILWPLQWPLSRLLFSTAYHPSLLVGRLPRVPLLFVHGTADRVVPYRESAGLFARASEPKELWTVEGGDHTEAFIRRAARYRPMLAEFFRKAIDSAPAQD